MEQCSQMYLKNSEKKLEIDGGAQVSEINNGKWKILELLKVLLSPL